MRQFRVPRMAVAIIAVAAGFAALPASAQVTSTTIMRDYHVGGDTPSELVSFLLNVPLRGDHGPAMANVRPRYRLDVTTRKQKSGCRVASVKLQVDFVMTLPKARYESRMSSSTRGKWRSFVSFAKRHEEGHKRIYLQCARTFAAKAQRLSGDTCWAVESEARRLLQTVNNDCERQHAAFDRKEGRRVTRLPLFTAARASARR